MPIVEETLSQEEINKAAEIHEKLRAVMLVAEGPGLTVASILLACATFNAELVHNLAKQSGNDVLFLLDALSLNTQAIYKQGPDHYAN